MEELVKQLGSLIKSSQVGVIVIAAVVAVLFGGALYGLVQAYTMGLYG